MLENIEFLFVGLVLVFGLIGAAASIIYGLLLMTKVGDSASGIPHSIATLTYNHRRHK